jgi:hypothetical protein
MQDFERHSIHENLDLSQPETPNWVWAMRISSNPLTAFQLIRRMSTQLPEILQNIESGRENGKSVTQNEQCYVLKLKTF